MAYKTKGMGKGTSMTKALGRMVGLLLVLYVFDRILSAVAPLLYSCPTGFLVNESTVGAGLTTVCYNTSGPTVGTVSASGSTWFADAVTLIQTLLPVLGILGAFEVIWGTLKASGLV